MTCVSIDPGIETGWAAWDTHKPTWKLVNVGILSPAGTAWDTRLRNLCMLFKAYVIEPYAPTKAIIEMGQFFESEGGQLCARRGDLAKLLLATGALYGMLRTHCNTGIVLVKPSQWKGQLPKKIVEQRIRRILGSKLCEQLDIQSHAWDAVGVGLWAQNRL